MLHYYTKIRTGNRFCVLLNTQVICQYDIFVLWPRKKHFVLWNVVNAENKKGWTIMRVNKSLVLTSASALLSVCSLVVGELNRREDVKETAKKAAKIVMAKQKHISN